MGKSFIAGCFASPQGLGNSSSRSTAFANTTPKSLLFTESQAQQKVFFNGTFSNFHVRVTANTRTSGTGTVILRKNSTDTSVFVSIPFGTTGWFSDTVNSASFSSGDLLNFMYTYGSGGTGTITYDSYMGVVDQTGNLRTILAHASSTTSYISNPRYSSIVGGGSSATEAPVQSMFPTGTIKNQYINVINERDGESFVYLRKNGVSQAASGLTLDNVTTFENTTMSISTANNDLISWRVEAGGTSGSLQSSIHSIEFETTDNTFMMLSEDGSNLTITSGSVFYYFLCGTGGLYNLSDTSSRMFCPIPDMKVSQFKVNVSTNTVNGNTPVTLMKNGSETGTSITIPTSTTGQFYNDTSSVSYTTNDTFNAKIHSAGTSGSLNIRSITTLWGPDSTTPTYNSAQMFMWMLQ